jgi:hypothetical protein
MTAGSREDGMEERIAHLHERAEQEYPESWIPEQAGEEIAGELVRYTRGTTAYGEQTIVILRTPEGVERSVWLLHTALREKCAALRPAPGELLLIRFEGKRRSAAGTLYSSYRVEIERDEPPPDWSAYSEDAGHPRTGPAPDEAMRELHAPLPASSSTADDDIPF